MGPTNNANLFNLVTGAEFAGGIGAEFERRNLVTPTLNDLSALFEDYESSPAPLTDPTLPIRLAALSHVQLGPLGIAGFDPSSAVDFGYGPLRVTGIAAPHHDEYTHEPYGTIRTRVCKLATNGHGENIEVFALNMFTPDGDASTITGEEQPSSLIIVGKGNRVASRAKPITGEVMAFAVRNKETGDAKLYRVTLEGADPTAPTPRSHIQYVSQSIAKVLLPSGHIAEIEVLGGQHQQQMVDELLSAASALRSAPKTELSKAERAILRDIG